MHSPSIIWVKYGFEGITPLKLHNTNVCCAILQSFVKNSCVTDVKNVCEQKNLQLNIELDALNKAYQAARSRNASRNLAKTKSAASAGSSNGPHPRVSSSRVKSPKMDTNSDNLAYDDTGKKYCLDEYMAGTSVRYLFVELLEERANTILKSRSQYAVMAVTIDDKGLPHAVPFVFTLQTACTEDKNLVNVEHS
ncbi:uncharacterized protein PHALS_04653 [Plasmopara halstedii]|uniref:Uncharacterized protein n=1 Tax=Plasmopara halstedii TaxID=4781 RepID=A0A0P1AAN3_PLAHL|nr:uncharacterized protein PHALS_04653 [Plasmopara halstedii]CEG37208.1 hypothetical protein PHALS_04653 [Plasmopara halstedii]|eukprot:XP_024573577.1 hypothetical protein PHALS_04653 [Plasmopara halstedii]